MKNISQLLVAAFVVVGLFSCNVIDITKKRYSNGYYISTSRGKKAEVKEQITNEKACDIAVVTKETKTEQSEPNASDNGNKIETVEKTQESSVVNNNSISNKTKANNKKKQLIVANDKPVFALKSSKLAVSKLQMNERKFIQKNANRNNHRIDDHQLLLIILAILLPPLAVFLVKGLDTMFWISLILTLLFYIPGIIFALLVVLGEI